MDLGFYLAGHMFVVRLGTFQLSTREHGAGHRLDDRSHERAERRSTATLSCLHLGVLLLPVFLFVGALILQLFGIGLKSLNLAGAQVIAYMRFRVLFPSDSAGSPTTEESEGGARQLAFCVLLLAGLHQRQRSGPLPPQEQNQAITKLMGFLLICIGMEFVLTSPSLA